MPSESNSAVHRTAEIRRETRETTIEVSLDVDGTGRANISTGIGFVNILGDT